LHLNSRLKLAQENDIMYR